MKNIYTTLRSWGFFTYGTIIPGLMLHGKPAPYPVLNERAVRAGAGMMFVLGMFAFFHAFYLDNFLFLQIFVVVFFFFFFMKTVIGTRFSPISQVAQLAVKNQTPEYVGAIQKRFAWSIGLVLAATMIILLFGFEVRGPINLAICAVCLLFMFLETSFGVCVGCKIYGLLITWGVLKEPEYRPACPGNVCAVE